MVRRVIIAALVAVSSAGSASAQEAALARLIEEAASVSPELAQARAEVEAERARIPQAGALPDPSLTLGIQNDGFKRIEVGTMETSFFNIMLTQPLFWPGKRGLREQVATLEARTAEARLSRAMLELEGRVSRAWVGLLLVRGQIELLAEEERLWSQAEQAARSRYESGQVPQSDLLRAQLERARLQQRRWSLDAQAATGLAEVNRLRAHPLDEAVGPSVRLADLPPPVVLAEFDAQKDAETRSPELRVALLAIAQSGRRLDLARKERLPDFSVTAAVMPRGSLQPMWQVGVSVGLPVFAGRKQSRAVDESQQREISQAQAAEALKQVLRLRTLERLSRLSALNRINQHYRTQLLVLSAAAARSTLAQYEAARVPFAAVLEALSGYLSDRVSHLASMADAQLVAIAQQEVSVEREASVGSGSGGNAMPRVSTTAAPTRPPAAGTSARSAETTGPSRGMNGM